MAEPARNIEPEVTQADSLVLKSEAKVEVFKDQVRSMITVNPDNTMLVTVKDADQFSLVQTVVKMIDTERKTVYNDANVLCKKADELHKSLVSKRDAAVAPYDTFKIALVSGGNAWRREEQRKAEAEAERLREIARKQAEEEQITQAAEAEKEGRIDEANEILGSQPIYVAPVPAMTVPKADGRIFRNPTIKVKVTNRLTFLSNVKPEMLADCLTEQAWQGIESGLSKKAKALGKAFTMPGCQTYEA